MTIEMKSCFLLWHTHTVEGVDDDDHEKLIGVYASSTDAQAAIERVKDQPGFKDYPEGFEVCEYTIGRDSWTEGFITWEEALKSLPEGGSN
jgi:hypothetical protein